MTRLIQFFVFMADLIVQTVTPLFVVMRFVASSLGGNAVAWRKHVGGNALAFTPRNYSNSS
jgi:hypothetical protein